MRNGRDLQPWASEAEREGHVRVDALHADVDREPTVDADHQAFRIDDGRPPFGPLRDDFRVSCGSTLARSHPGDELVVGHADLQDAHSWACRELAPSNRTVGGFAFHTDRDVGDRNVAVVRTG
jgi:hypothetical protein